VSEKQRVPNDPAMGNSIYARKEGDFYETPEWVTEALIPHLRSGPVCLHRNRTVWEPAAGRGKMSRVLERHFQTVLSTTLESTDPDDLIAGGLDFLKAQNRFELPDAIITNPPYSLAEEFVRHALKLAVSYGFVIAMLLRNEWDCAKGRNDLFTEQPFAKKVILTSRPWWFDKKPGDSGPRHNYAWYIWVKDYTGPPVIGYGEKEQTNG
jgi:hypothetical protein